MSTNSATLQHLLMDGKFAAAEAFQKLLAFSGSENREYCSLSYEKTC